MEKNLTEDKKIYIQIKEMIEKEILEERLLEDAQVPSTNVLAKEYSINPNTAGKGIKMLADEGILYKKRGIGMFVTKGARQNVIQKRKGDFYNRYVKSLLAEASILEITKDDLVQMILESGEKTR